MLQLINSTPPERRLTPALLVLSLLLPLLAATPTRAQSRDGFYRQRQVAGERAAVQGDLTTAARELELAAFGMLENPSELAAILLSLTEVQSRDGDQPAFIETALRLVDLEEQFGAYGGLPESFLQRQIEFEAAVLAADLPIGGTRFDRLVKSRQGGASADRPGDDAAPPTDGPRADPSPPPLESVRRDPSERPPAAEQSGLEDEALRRDRLRTELLTSAETGAIRRARRAANQLLAVEPGSPAARCLLTALDRSAADCRKQLESLASCTEEQLSHLVTESHLDCSDRLRDPSIALARLERLPDQQRARYAKAERRASKRSRPSADGSSLSDPETMAARVEPDTLTASVLTEESSNERQVDEPDIELATARPVSEDSPQVEAVETSRPEQEPAALADETAEMPSAETIPTTPAEELARAEMEARTIDDLEALWDRALTLAEDAPSLETHRVVGRLAYRTGRWASAIRFLTLDGPPSEPASLFYLAVSLHQTGYTSAAADALTSSRQALRQTPFVTGWIERILSSTPSN